MVPTAVDVKHHVYSVTSSDVHLKRVSSAGMEFAVSVLELQALVYDILPSATAVFSYTAIGPRKLSANEQFLSVLVLRQ